MPAERYYIDKPLEPHTEARIEGAELYHLRVMRSSVGDTVELVNGHGALATATIQQMAKHHATLLIQEVTLEPKPTFELILGQAMPRLNRLDFVLEKGTELGMTQLWLFPGNHSERKSLNENQLSHLRGVTIAAMKQCGRLHLPSISILNPLAGWPTPTYPLFFGDLNSQAPLFATAWQQQRPTQGAIFVTGPESGFNLEEINRLKALSGIGVKLHPHVLRTDTASIVALSLMAHWLFHAPKA